MLNSITAAQHPHVFEYRGWEVETSGNPLAHAILRGSVDSDGKNIPNYHYEDLIKLCTRYEEKNLQNPAIIVDANHSNSGKQYLEQIRICKEVLHSCRHHAGIQHMVKGFMIESYLVDGNQKVGRWLLRAVDYRPLFGMGKNGAPDLRFGGSPVRKKHPTPSVGCFLFSMLFIGLFHFLFCPVQQIFHRIWRQIIDCHRRLR